MLPGHLPRIYRVFQQPAGHLRQSERLQRLVLESVQSVDQSEQVAEPASGPEVAVDIAAVHPATHEKGCRKTVAGEDRAHCDVQPVATAAPTL